LTIWARYRGLPRIDGNAWTKTLRKKTSLQFSIHDLRRSYATAKHLTLCKDSAKIFFAMIGASRVLQNYVAVSAAPTPHTTPAHRD
jgi:hypothetical protein